VATIIEACRRNDVAQLRQWGRQGVRVVFAEPLVQSVGNAASLTVLRCLVKDLGAAVNRANEDGFFPLFMAAQEGLLAHVRCLVKELGADAHQADFRGRTPLFIAAQEGFLSVVRCMGKELGADINKASHDGRTPLMAASARKQFDVVVWLVKEGANTQATVHGWSVHVTAADLSKATGTSAEQTAYLEAKTHCSNPGCSGAGIKKCPACKQARYCGELCQYTHWKAKPNASGGAQS
jgi:hypothetical protein